MKEVSQDVNNFVIVSQKPSCSRGEQRRKIVSDIIVIVRRESRLDKSSGKRGMEKGESPPTYDRINRVLALKIKHPSNSRKEKEERSACHAFGL